MSGVFLFSTWCRYLYGCIFNSNILLRRWKFVLLVCRGGKYRMGFALHVRGLGCAGNGIIDGYVWNAIGGNITISRIHIHSRKVG